MAAKGTFDVDLTPQDDGDFPAGRMLISKNYAGDMVGSGTGQMISKRTDDGTAAYFAIEEFDGVIDGKTGSLTLTHRGFMSSATQQLEVLILPGSGTGQLSGISGSLSIEQDESGHRYELSYAL